MSRIQKGWIAPDEWDRIFTAAILEVAEDLKIDVKGELNSKENCLYTRVTADSWYECSINDNLIIEGKYKKESNQNININGLDYKPEYEKIVLSTCVGVTNHWFNERLYPKLYDKNSNTLTKYGVLVEKFCATFHGISFTRMQRYARAHYRWIKNYNSLADYFEAVMQSGIWDGYNLEYLQVCTPPLNLKLILKEDSAEIAELKKQIKFHFILMLLLDWILQQP